MNCPDCGSVRIAVRDVYKPAIDRKSSDLKRTLAGRNGVSRRRECLACGNSFVTVELAEEVPDAPPNRGGRPPGAALPKCTWLLMGKRGRPPIKDHCGRAARRVGPTGEPRCERHYEVV